MIWNNLFPAWWLNSDCHLLAGLTFLSVNRNSPLFFVFKFVSLVWQTNPNKVFPSLEDIYPLEEGSQAALQTPLASEGLWCSAVDCAPKEDTTGGGPAETCFNSASCQLPEGEHWLGTVVPWPFCCAVREGTNPVWTGKKKGYLCEILWCRPWYRYSVCCLFWSCGFFFSGRKLWQDRRWRKLCSLSLIPIPKVHQQGYLE